MRRALLCACAAALLAPSSSWAHGTIRPTLVAPGSTHDFSIVIPVPASSPAVVGLTLTAPTATRIVSAASSPPRWNASVGGSDVTWTGGPIVPGSYDSFGFRATVPKTPGTVTFSANELYAGGQGATFSLDVVVFDRAAPPAAASRDEGTRTLALFALVVAIVAVVLAGAALIVSLARWLRG